MFIIFFPVHLDLDQFGMGQGHTPPGST